MGCRVIKLFQIRAGLINLRLSYGDLKSENLGAVRHLGFDQNLSSH